MFPLGSTPPPVPEPEPEAVEEPSDIDMVVHDPVLRHRAVFFAELGMNPRQARALALDRRVDTHWVRDRLINRGCSPDIAFDIASY